MVEIKVEEYEHWWRCGDGCCDNLDTVSRFHYDSETYEYRGYSSEENLKNFLIDNFDLVFEYDYVNFNDVA